MRRRLAAPTVMLLLASCVTPPTVEQTTGAQTLWRQHHAQMSAVSAWQVRGRMAMRTTRKGGNATLLWRHGRDAQSIELYGPFGSDRVRIKVNAGGATLLNAKGGTLTGATAGEVLERALGWRVPFDKLRYWVRGVPSHGDADLTLDSGGKLKTLREGDWRVDYDDYRAVGGLSLPHKLTITAAPGSIKVYDRDGAHIGDELRVKVILKNWRDLRVE